MTQRYILPADGRIVELKPSQVPGYARAGYVPAPWDCVCQGRCRCHLRPVKPPPERLEEARADLDRREAAIAEVEEELGLREPETGDSPPSSPKPAKAKKGK